MESTALKQLPDYRHLPHWPEFSQKEAEIVSGVLLSNKVNYWTGEEGKQFEKEYAAYVGARHGIAMANGTVVLEAALKALAIKSGDEVIVTSRTFIASISSIVSVGAIPVFADVNRDSQNIDAATIAPLLSERTRAIICVHLAGWPCEMNEINELADVHKLAVIEDCAQAHGAAYYGESVGRLGHIGCWSFCQDKIISTGGEGGMVTTDDKELWSTMWSLKDHGKAYDLVHQVHPAGFRWVHADFGTNWRMTEMQSALGRYQLSVLPQWSNARLDLASAIWGCAAKLPGLRVPEIPSHIKHAAYRCYVFVEPKYLKSSWSRDRIVDELSAVGVQVMQGSCSEVYREKAFENTGYAPAKRLPVAVEIGETSLMFKVHPNMTKEDGVWICDQLQVVMAQAAL